ncbi:hypothetical protein X946_5241 [Burkholderia sp. ABCPW 111]|nr:hypothetical protein X946_5241 [Burkholderia sp. ABCPW 111]
MPRTPRSIVAKTIHYERLITRLKTAAPHVTLGKKYRTGSGRRRRSVARKRSAFVHVLARLRAVFRIYR